MRKHDHTTNDPKIDILYMSFLGSLFRGRKMKQTSHNFLVTVTAPAKLKPAEVQKLLQNVLDDGQTIAMDEDSASAAIAGNMGINVSPMRRLFLIVDNDNGDVFPQGLFMADNADTFKKGKALLDAAASQAQRNSDEWNYDQVRELMEAAGCHFFEYEEVAEGEG